MNTAIQAIYASFCGKVFVFCRYSRVLIKKGCFSDVLYRSDFNGYSVSQKLRQQSDDSKVGTFYTTIVIAVWQESENDA